MPVKSEKKIGILVVAYNAETTLARVLDRIPETFRLLHQRSDRQR